MVGGGTYSHPHGALLAGLLSVVAFVAPAAAVEYRLQVANLHRDSFPHYFDGPLGTRSGEPAMGRLGRALDTDEAPSRALLSGWTFRYG